MVRINDRGEVIVSVAVPVQRFRAVHGALAASTQGGDIDQMVTAERLAILKIFARRRRGDDRAVAAAGIHHRRPGAPARRQRRAGSPPDPDPRGIPISPAAATRSAISSARCAT